jgi:hypothetical protein
MAAAANHLRAAKRQGETDHRIEGLVDLETGELVLRGLNLNGFRAMFRPETIKPKAVRPDGQARATKADRPASATPSAGRKGFVVVGSLEVSGVVELLFQADVSAHPEAFSPDVLSDEKARAAEMGRWVEQCLVRFHIDHAQALGFDRFFMDAIAGSAPTAVAYAGGD